MGASCQAASGGRVVSLVAVMTLALALCGWVDAFGPGPAFGHSASSRGPQAPTTQQQGPQQQQEQGSRWALSRVRQQAHTTQQQDQQQAQEASLLDFLLERAAAQPSLGAAISPKELWARVEHLQRTLFASLPPSSIANVTTMCQRAPDIVLQLDQAELGRRVAERQQELKALLPSCDPRRLIIKTPSLLLDEFVHARVVVERLGEEFHESLDLGRVIYANPVLLIRQWDGLAEKIEALRALFQGQDLARMIHKRPDLLSRDVGKLREKMEGLASFSPELDVASLVARHPELLGRSMSLLQANYDALCRLFAGKVNLASMLNRKPSLLLANTDKVLVKKLARLTALLNQAAALKVAELQPSIFNRDFDIVEARVDALRRHLPALDVVRFVLGFPGFLVADGGEVEVGERLRALRQALPPGVGLVQVLTLEPRVYAEDVHVLATKVTAVLQATELAPAELAAKTERDPRFLAVPYPSLVARCDFLGALLGSAGMQRISLSSMSCMPLRRFGEMYPTYEAYLTAKLAEAAAAAKGGPPPSAVSVGGSDKRRRWMGGLLGLEREYGTLLWRLLTKSDQEDGSSSVGGAGGSPYPLPPLNGFMPPRRSPQPPRSRQPPSASLAQQKQPQPVLSSR